MTHPHGTDGIVPNLQTLEPNPKSRSGIVGRHSTHFRFPRQISASRYILSPLGLCLSPRAAHFLTGDAKRHEKTLVKLKSSIYPEESCALLCMFG